MQQTIGVAVVAAHLAATDRRALSQAWYSALHLAEHTTSPRTAPAGTLLAARSRTRSGPPFARPAAGGGGPHSTAGAGARRGAALARGPQAAACERRSARTDLSRTIERALARRTPRSGAASFAIRTSGGRIHVVVRSESGRTRVFAVCAGALRERVERALAQARFALAARGVRTEVA